MARIDLSAQARTHPLFPLLDYLARSAHAQQTHLQSLRNSIAKVEDDICNIKVIQAELEKLIKEFGEASFEIEKTAYQPSLRRGAADLFCNSLFRSPDDESITRMIRSVLRDDVRIKFKLDASLKYVTGLIVTFRSEERRRVLSPSGKYKNQNTKQFSKLIMGYLKASDESFPNYYKNLALLRKYVRETHQPKEQKKIYGLFKDWAIKTFNPSGCPSPDQWKAILEEDERQNYSDISHEVEPTEPQIDNGNGDHCDLDLDMPVYNFM